MKKEKMLKVFEPISKFDIYSRYSNTLEKKFKDKSLKSFVNSLKHLKPREKEPFLVEFLKKHPYEFEEKKILDDDNNEFSLRIQRYEEERDREKEPKINNSPIKYELRSSFSSKRYMQGHPDPFKYNPNYNSIYKNVPSFKMNPKQNHSIKIKNLKEIKERKNKFNKNKSSSNDISSNDNISDEEKEKDIFENKLEKYSKSKSKSKSKNKNKNQIDSQSSNSVSDIKSINREKNLDLPLITTTNIVNPSNKEANNRLNTIPTDGYRDNHALRFSKYLPRRIKFGSISNKLSYVEPHNYALDTNKGIDFGKLKPRDEKSIVNVPSLDVPIVGKYNPKYTYIQNNARNVLFSPFGRNKKDKRVLLHKVLGSYKVSPNFEIIDDKKLFRNQDLINKQLIINYNINPL